MMAFYTDKVEDDLKFLKLIKSNKEEEARFLYMKNYVYKDGLDMKIYGYLSIRSFCGERIDFTARKILVEKFKDIGEFKTFFDINNNSLEISLKRWQNLGIPTVDVLKIVLFVNRYNDSIKEKREIEALESLLESLNKS